VDWWDRCQHAPVIAALDGVLDGQLSGFINECTAAVEACGERARSGGEDGKNGH
jgi:hypothetical protein